MTGKTRRGELIGFIERVLARNPQLGEHYAKRLAGEGRAEGLESVEASAADLPGLVASSSWQEHVIDRIHAREATKPNQHPIGKTAFYGDTSTDSVINGDLLGSRAGLG